MGCGSSVEDAALPRKKKYRKDLNHVEEDGDDPGVQDYLGDPTDMDPHARKGFAVSTYAKKITLENLSTYERRHVQAAVIPMTIRDDRELKHLAMAFGRDAKGRPIQDYYLPQARELSKEDGDVESAIFRKLGEMEKDETMMSDGRLTSEPNALAYSIGKSVDATKAKWACREHEKDDDEMKYINRPCDPEIKFKVRIWDGCFDFGLGLENPGDPEECARLLKEKKLGSPTAQPTATPSAVKNAKTQAAITTNSGASTKTATTTRDDLSDQENEKEHPFAPADQGQN